MSTDRASARRRANSFSHVAKAGWGKGVGTLWRITRLNLRHPWQVTICIVSTFIAATLQLFVPRLLGHAVDPGGAIAVPVQARAAAIEQIEHAVRIDPTAGRQIEADSVVLAADLGKVPAVSTGSSSPSTYTSFSWSIRMALGSR